MRAAAGAARHRRRSRRSSRSGSRPTLRHYQLDGFRWLAFLGTAGLGGILADDMGLGKTVQTLALVAHARERAAPTPFLVVAPDQRGGELGPRGRPLRAGPRRCARSPSPRPAAASTLAEAVDGADLVVTSYALFRLEFDDYVAHDVGRPGARRGAVRQEPPGQDLPVRPPARRALQARDHRHAAGEPPDGAVVAAVDRGARPVPRTRSGSPSSYRNPIEQQGDAACAATGSAAGSGRSCSAAPRTRWPPTCRPSRSRCSRSSSTPRHRRDLRDPPAARAAEGARPASTTSTSTGSRSSGR